MTRAILFRMKASWKEIAQWIAVTMVTAAGTVFTLMQFAYSDFDTRRTNDVYRDQLEKRLEKMDRSLERLEQKLDQVLQSR